MTSARFASLRGRYSCALLAALLALTGITRAQDVTAPEAPVQVTFFNSSLIDEIIPFYEAISGRRVIVDQSIAQTTLSLNTSQPLSRGEAVDFLKASLLLNGIAIVYHDDKTDKFLNSSVNQPAQEGIQIISNAMDLPTEDVVVSFVMLLQYITPDEAVRTLQLVARPHAYGSITPVPNAGAVIITDKVPLIRTLIGLQEYIDKPAGEVNPKEYILVRSDATVVATAISEIVNQQAAGASGATATRVVGTAPANVGNRSVPVNATAVTATIGGENAPPQITPIPRRNALLVIARPVDQIFVESLIEIFDAPSEVDTFLKKELKYIPVFNFTPVAAAALERYVSEGVAGGGATSPTRTAGAAARTTGTTRNTGGTGATTGGAGGQGRFGTAGGSSLQVDDLGGPEPIVIGNTLLIGDPQLNNVIVSGPPEHLRIVEQLIEELDVRPRQVYISAVIAQVSLDDEIRFGFDLLRQVEEIEIGGDPVNIAGLYRTNSQVAIIDPLDLQTVSDFTPTLATGGLSIYAKIGDFLNAYIQALETTSKFQVISRPFVFADNNESAFIASGERVAVPTQTISSVTNNDTVNSSIGFEEVLLELEVVPLINSKDEVTLQIRQGNENITGFTTISNNEVPNIATQQLETKVRIPNRGIVVIGGIIQEEDRDNINGFPFISRIPGLRHLLGTTVQAKDRRELLIFIQPTIIESTEDLIDANIEETNRTVVGQNAIDMARMDPISEPILYDDTQPEAVRGTNGSDAIPPPDNGRLGQKIRNLINNPNRRRLFGSSRGSAN